jgi:hypothetical protein
MRDAAVLLASERTCTHPCLTVVRLNVAEMSKRFRPPAFSRPAQRNLKTIVMGISCVEVK